MSASRRAASPREAAPAFLALGCVGLAFATPAFAADSAPSGDGGDGDDPGQHDRARRDEILVHGQRPSDKGYGTDHASSVKFTAPLLDTPRSVTVIPHELIRDTASASLTEALRTVPGITLGAGEGGNPLGDRPFIRGYDSQASTYLDGVRDIAAQSRETFDIDSIEVIKGSDGAFGGRGSPGGSINLVSKLPGDKDFAEVTGVGGTADYRRVTGDLNYHISDIVAVRLAAVYHDQGIAGRDAVRQKRWGIAPAVTIGLGTPTRLTLQYYHLESHELPDSGIPYLYTTANLPAGIHQTRPIQGDFTTIAGEVVHRPRDAYYGLTDRDFRHTQVDEATMRVEHDVDGSIKLSNTARYAHTIQNYRWTLPDDSNGDVYGNTASGTNPYNRGGYIWRRSNNRYGSADGLLDQTDLSGTITTVGIKHSFAIGSEFSWEDSQYGNYVLSTGSTISPRCNPTTVSRFYCTSASDPNPKDPWVNYTSDTSTVRTPILRPADSALTLATTRTLAGYAFDTITLTKWLLLNGGVRYDDYNTRVRQPVVAGARPTFGRHDGIWTGQGSAIAKPTHDTSVYFTYATAAVPPGTFLGQGSETNALVPGRTERLTPSDLKVESTESYEVGAKADLFHERLSLTAAAFELKTRNARVTSDTGTVQNVGSRRIRGFEIGYNGAITPSWKIFGGYTYLDAKITDGGSTATTGTVNGRTITILAPSVNTGKRFPNTAKHSFTAFTSYQATKRLSVGGGTIYMGKVYGGYGDLRSINGAGQLVITNALARYVPHYWRFDANAAYTINRYASVQVNVLNLTNKLYYDQAYASHYANQAAGRTALVTLALKY